MYGMIDNYPYVISYQINHSLPNYQILILYMWHNRWIVKATKFVKAMNYQYQGTKYLVVGVGVTIYLYQDYLWGAGLWGK